MRPFIARAFALILLMAFASMLPGCGDGKAAATFNDNIVRSLQRLNTVGQKFGRTIEPLSQGENANPALVRQAHDESVEVLTAIKAEMTTWKIPARESAQQLNQSFVNMMKNQEGAIALFGDVTKVVEDTKLANNVRSQRIAEIFKNLEGSEQAALSDLQAKQRAFAKDHNIKLITK